MFASPACVFFPRCDLASFPFFSFCLVQVYFFLYFLSLFLFLSFFHFFFLIFFFFLPLRPLHVFLYFSVIRVSSLYCSVDGLSRVSFSLFLFISDIGYFCICLSVSLSHSLSLLSLPHFPSISLSLTFLPSPAPSPSPSPSPFPLPLLYLLSISLSTPLYLIHGEFTVLIKPLVPRFGISSQIHIVFSASRMSWLSCGGLVGARRRRTREMWRREREGAKERERER